MRTSYNRQGRYTNYIYVYNNSETNVFKIHIDNAAILRPVVCKKYNSFKIPPYVFKSLLSSRVSWLVEAKLSVCNLILPLKSIGQW